MYQQNKMMMSNLLKSRWLTATNKDSLLQTLIRNINRSVFYEKSPFDLINDYVDFRGVDFSRQRIKDVVIKKVDFSFSTFNSGWIEGSTFSGVKFESVDFSGIVDVGNEFNDCIFKNCKFNRTAFGYSGTKFNSCTFDGCNFLKAIFIRGEFSLCNFNECKLKGIDFNASSFETCTFIGCVEDVWFRGGYALPSDVSEFGAAKGNKMKDVSFAAASVVGATFSNYCDLSSIILPVNGQYFLFDNWLDRLEKLKVSLAEWPKEQKREGEIFANSYLVHAISQNWYLLNEKDVQDAVGIEVSKKILTELRSV